MLRHECDVLERVDYTVNLHESQGGPRNADYEIGFDLIDNVSKPSREVCKWRRV
jgi:hypothetical protein